jgi:hypothetical protein
MRRGTVAVATVFLSTVGVFGAAGPAQAAFPGTNGPIAYVDGTGRVGLVDPTISPPVTQQITTTISGFNSVNFDATGTRLVGDTDFAAVDGIVFLEPRAETPVTPLAGGDPADASPAFDPTGTKIVFQNNGDLFTQNVDGTGRTNLTAANPNTLSRPDWSPNGQFIVFQDGTDAQIKRLTVADGTIVTLTPPAAGCAASTPCQEPSYSPDGRHVAYDQDGATANGIYDVLSDATATAVTRISAVNDDQPAYSPQGDQVALQDSVARLAVVRAADGSGRAQVGAFFVTRPSWGIKQVAPPTPPPTNAFSFGALSRNKKKGTATQTLTVPGSGELVVGGSGVVSQRVTAKSASRLFVTAGEVKVPIEATGKPLKKLGKNGKAKVTVSFTFTPDGGTANTQTRKIKLKKKLKK